MYIIPGDHLKASYHLSETARDGKLIKWGIMKPFSKISIFVMYTHAIISKAYVIRNLHSFVMFRSQDMPF